MCSIKQNETRIGAFCKTRFASAEIFLDYYTLASKIIKADPKQYLTVHVLQVQV